jgi:hypothetical protein
MRNMLGSFQGRHQTQCGLHPQGLQDQISGSVLPTRKGDGHTSYAVGGEASRLMDAFWVNGTMPALGTVVTL